MILLASAALAADLRATGRAEANLRVGINDCSAGCPWIDFHDAAVVGGEVVADFDRKVVVVADADLRAHAGTELTALEDSGEVDIVSPLSIKLHEASITMAGLGAPWFDVGFGVQRVHWGTADGMSVVDNVNPFDLEDPTRLDARLAVPLLVLTAHPSIVQLQAVWAPFFVPAALPTDQVDVLAGARDLFDVDGQNATDVRQVESRVTMPEESILESAVAGRVAIATGPVDAALSWYHGRDSLPQVGGLLVLTGFSTDRSRVDVGIPVLYPKVDVGGAELRGELPWELGGWAEAAVVLPEKTVATMSAGQLEALATLGAIDEVPDPIPSTVTQDGEPYVRAVVGVDRSFGRVYLNLQWLHGFFTERQASDLREYGVAAVRVTLTDRWVLGARAVSDGVGAIVGGEVRYLHGDAAEWSVGATWIPGESRSPLGGFTGASNLGTRVAVTF